MSYTRTTAGLRDAGEYGYGPQGPHAFSAQAHVESPRAQLLARISMALGGRTAEEIIFGRSNTGASNDIQRATQYARYMQTRIADQLIKERP